jgi:hypothetical protein
MQLSATCVSVPAPGIWKFETQVSTQREESPV